MQIESRRWKICILKTIRYGLKNEDTNIWKEILCWWIEGINIAKMFILFKAIEANRFKAIPIKIPTSFFIEIKNKIVWNHQRHQIAKAILQQKNKARGSTCPDFKQYNKTWTTKTNRHWHKNRDMNQWNRIKSPNINLWIYHQLIFVKEVKNTQWKRYSLNKWCWGNLLIHMQKNETGPPS